MILFPGDKHYSNFGMFPTTLFLHLSLPSSFSLFFWNTTFAVFILPFFSPYQTHKHFVTLVIYFSQTQKIKWDAETK